MVTSHLNLSIGVLNDGYMYSMMVISHLKLSVLFPVFQVYSRMVIFYLILDFLFRHTFGVINSGVHFHCSANFFEPSVYYTFASKVYHNYLVAPLQ